MMYTYEEYLTKEKALSVEQMEQIHRQIIEEVGTDADALEIYDELMGVVTRYAEIRVKWPLMGREEKRDKDSLRTSCHDSVITHFNMLARYLKTQGKTAAWRDTLGYEEENRYNRKAIGDFACYLVFLNSINAR